MMFLDTAYRWSSLSDKVELYSQSKNIATREWLLRDQLLVGELEHFRMKMYQLKADLQDINGAI